MLEIPQRNYELGTEINLEKAVDVCIMENPIIKTNEVVNTISSYIENFYSNLKIKDILNDESVYRNITDRILSPKVIALALLKTHPDLPVNKVLKDAHFILDFYGSNGRILDNVLEPEDRQLFYQLEEEGYVSIGREETFLSNGHEWRTHYWAINTDKIIENANKLIEILETGKFEDFLNEKSVLIKENKKDTEGEFDYNNISEEMWSSRKGFSPEII